MRKLFIIFFSVALFLPLYAQERDTSVDGTSNEERQPEQNDGFSFSRQYFEFGFNIGLGVDNNLIRSGDIFKKNVVIDLDEYANRVGGGGIKINTEVKGEIFYLDIKDIKIEKGIWNFGIFANVETAFINLNIPKSLVTLITEGNRDKHYFNGTITASGAAFAGVGLRSSAQYGKLKIGFSPSVFAPLLFIPKSGIRYTVESEDSIYTKVDGKISVYSPFTENGDLKFGSDFTIKGEYALFPFLNVGASLSNIPLTGAKLKNRMLLEMDPIEIIGDDLLVGKGFEIPDTDDLFSKNYDSPKSVTVRRPLRFDTYAEYRPFGRLLLVKPNMGFSVDLNENEGYFNTGLEAQINLIDLLIFYLGSGIEDSIWKQRVGLALNLRAFELDLEACFRSTNFTGSFQGEGFGIYLGCRFGW
ncbi:MAG: hypothetical protein FWH53_07300 [Leptospirales bacterium]|nr:hypothetical protein [Leptospirales bacterium]